MFSGLSDWYAFQRFCSRADPPLQVHEWQSPFVGYIGSLPDRRAPELQARVLCKQLYAMTAGYPEFRHEIRRDFRTLVRSQLRLLSRPSRAPGAFRFLRGMLAERRAHAHLVSEVQSQMVN